MLSDDLDKLVSGGEKIIAESVANLERNLIEETPVDTGQLKATWETKKLRDGSWLISNNMNYADIIFNGRRLVPKKGGGMMWVGSLKGFTDGYHPILQRHNNELDRRLALLKG